MIYHIALPQDWAAAQGVGSYAISTRGVTLEEEGFIHCDTREGPTDRSLIKPAERYRPSMLVGVVPSTGGWSRVFEHNPGGVRTTSGLCWKINYRCPAARPPGGWRGQQLTFEHFGRAYMR